MALVTKVKAIEVDPRIERFSDASAADTALTVTTPIGVLRQILFVTVKYSASVIVSPTMTLNSGIAAAYDTLLQTIDGSGGVTDLVWIPDEEFWIMDDDVLNALAPAGGGVITSAIAIYTRSY